MLAPSLIETLSNALLVFGLTGAVAFDVRSRRVPNAVVAPVALLGLAVNLIGHGLAGLGDGVGGMLVGMGILLPVWLAGGMGAGDVKLLGMVGAIRGVQFVLWSGLFGAAAGGVLALLALAFRRGGVQVLRNVGSYLYRAVVLQVPGGIEPTPSSFRMSYALALALGAVIAHFHAYAAVR